MNVVIKMQKQTSLFVIKPYSVLIEFEDGWHEIYFSNNRADSFEMNSNIVRAVQFICITTDDHIG